MGTIHDVRYFDSDMAGAPSTAGMAAAGRMIVLLDACLVNGFNLKSVTSLVVADGVATVTTDGDHNFRDYTVIRIAGATPDGLNGDWKITLTGGATFTFPTTEANGTATGTISAKTAPLGWTKEFAATNVGVYRPKTGLRHYFRVNDASQYVMQYRGYEAMTGAGDGGTNPFPTATQLPAGVGMSKYYSNAAYVQKWFLIGDDRCVYLVYNGAESYGVSQDTGDWAIYGFGEAISYVPGDLGHSFVIGNNANAWSPNANQNGSSVPGGFYTHSYTGCYFSRPFSQELGNPVRFRIAGNAVCQGWGSSPSAYGRVPYPNPADLSILFHTPIWMQEENSKAVRGELPGPYQPLHSYMHARIGDVVVVNGRKILLTHAFDADSGGDGVNSAGAGTGVMGWDITGPWR